MAKKYRDTLFRHYFNDKARLLELCNALVGEDGKNPDEITINTLDGLFFGKLKNDLSCVYRGKFLIIIEHQSTINENMPLRMLFYVAELLKQYIEPFKELLHQPKLLHLPRPEFFIFYNGRKKSEEFREMKLSDAFGGNCNIELAVKFYNINAGFNENFIKNVAPLKEYCFFVNRVEENKLTGMDINHAISEAINYCTENGVMARYLKKHKKEVLSMLGFEYNETEEKAALANYYRAEGMLEGREEGILEGRVEGRMKGRVEGREETMIDVVKKMLDIKLPIDQIMQISGWTKEQIFSFATKI